MLKSYIVRIFLFGSLTSYKESGLYNEISASTQIVVSSNPVSTPDLEPKENRAEPVRTESDLMHFFFCVQAKSIRALQKTAE